MKIKIVILGVIFLSILLCGCIDDIFPDSLSAKNKVVVTVQASAFVEEYDYVSQIYKPVTNKTVNFEVTKTGGESFQFYAQTGQDGYAEFPEVGYNLYENQVITVYFSTDGVTDSETLTFSAIYDESETDQTFTWDPLGSLRLT